MFSNDDSGCHWQDKTKKKTLWVTILHCTEGNCKSKCSVLGEQHYHWQALVTAQKYLVFQRWKPYSQILYNPCQFARNLVNKIFVSKVTKHFTLLFQSVHFQLLYYVKDAVHCLLPYLTCDDHTISNTKNLAGFFFFSWWHNLHF